MLFFWQFMDASLHFTLQEAHKLLAQPTQVLLMSATLDAKGISDYFGGAPLVEVPPEPRYPVEEVYLDEIFHLYPPGSVGARAAIHEACLWEQQQIETGARTREFNARAEGTPEDPEATQAVQTARNEHSDLLTSLSAEQSRPRPKEGSVYVVAADLCAKLSTDLLAEAEAEGGTPRGSILCFLPGMEHIRAVERHLKTLPQCVPSLPAIVRASHLLIFSC